MKFQGVLTTLRAHRGFVVPRDYDDDDDDDGGINIPGIIARRELPGYRLIRLPGAAHLRKLVDEFVRSRMPREERRKLCYRSFSPLGRLARTREHTRTANVHALYGRAHGRARYAR